MNFDLDAIFAALGDSTRRRIIELLADQALRPSELAEHLRITRPAISRHLRVLREAGLLLHGTDEEDFRASLSVIHRQAFVALEKWSQHIRQS